MLTGELLSTLHDLRFLSMLISSTLLVYQGLTRLSPRSMVAVPLFFIFGALSASQIYAVPTSKANRALGILSASPQDPLVWDWTIGAAGWRLAALSLAFGAVAWLLSAVSVRSTFQVPTRSATLTCESVS